MWVVPQIELMQISYISATWFYLPYWGNGRYIGNMHLLFEEAGRMASAAFLSTRIIH